MDNTSVQSPNDILTALSTLGTSIFNQPTPTVNIPALNFTPPTGSDMSAKFQQFLTEAANDPNLTKYYDQLLAYAKGDTDIAIQQLKTDYTTGVRQTLDTLGNTLKQMGLTFTGESKNLLDTLNKRGIALTQEGRSGPLTYAGGGEAGTEVGQLNDSQKLRQEAEQRTAKQKIETSGLSLNKGITQANQALQNQAIGLGQQKQQDVYNRAGLNFGAYQQSQAIDAQKALYGQTSGGSGSSNPYAGLDPTQIPSDVKQQLWIAHGHAGTAPAGYGGD